MSNNEKPVLHHIITDPTKGVNKSLAEEEEDINARRQRLERSAPNMDAPGRDTYTLPANQRHSYVDDATSKRRSFDQKVYLFPESFNALRRELQENYKNFFESVNPEVGVSPAWAMVHDAAQFIGLMNGAFDCVEQMDSENVDGICKVFLNAARKKRGVSPLSWD